MGAKTEIAWTDATWNPIRGCSRISEGCRNCYAEKIAARFSSEGEPFHLFADRSRSGSKWTGTLGLVESRLLDPIHWRAPRRIFVNSMSDMFHEELPKSFIHAVLAVISQANHHIYQALTKRSNRLLEIMSDPDLEDYIDEAGTHEFGWCHANAQKRFPLPYLWLGVSVENRATKRRIEHLRRTPAAVRFLSLEPLLEDLGDLNLDGIHWVIAGAESGDKSARPCEERWVRRIKDQCVERGIPFFYKQAALNGKKILAPVLDGRKWEEFPNASH